MSRGENQGLTVLELMVIVVIVATLVAIAVPIYSKAIKNRIISEAIDRCNEIVVEAKDWAKTHEIDGSALLWPPAKAAGVDVTASAFFTFSYTGDGSRADLVPLSVMATGIKGTRMEGVTVQVTVPNINRNAGQAIVLGL